MQKLGIALDIGGEIEQLLRTIRQDAIDPFAQYCRILPYVVPMYAASGAY
jgi:hypothetical protein